MAGVGEALTMQSGIRRHQDYHPRRKEMRPRQTDLGELPTESIGENSLLDLPEPFLQGSAHPK
jgi:hypothetical protein